MLGANLVINKILQKKDYSVVSANSLERKHFVGYEQEFDYITDHYKQYGNVPDTIVFLSHFPKFDLMEVNESDDFLVEKIHEEYGYTQFAKILPILSKKITEDSREAYEFLKNEIDNLRPKHNYKGIDIIANAQERYETYSKRSNMGTAAYISTGLPELDDIINGFDYGDELVTIFARTSVGKSWILTKFLLEALRQGKKVGLYSGEMSQIKLGYRFDCLYKNYSNRALVKGQEIQGYKEYIDNLHDSFKSSFIVITQKEFGGRPTVQQIRNFIVENNIEIMGIDQYSLMEDSRGKVNDPLRIKYAHITEDLFALSSELKIPIIGLAQANRDATRRNDDGLGLENIKESDDISHNSSKCIGLRQSSGTLVLDIIKNREGKSGDKLRYEWDIDKGRFRYLKSANENDTPENKKLSIERKEMYEPINGVCPF